MALHYLLFFAVFVISDFFDLKGTMIKYFFKKKKNFIIFILIFSIFFILLSMLILSFYNKEKLQVLNFVFSFLVIFEVCLKISQSERFKYWIGENLDNSLRLFIMFILCLNCTYFFTRLTLQIIESF